MSNQRLLVVDDSVTIRATIEQLFDQQRDMKVVGVVSSAEDADEAIRRLHPDVLTLDISMPGMDGLTFLGALMRDRPMPVVVVSSSSTLGSEVCDRAIALGAAQCFDKAQILSNAQSFIKVVRNAKRGKVRDEHVR